jgi:hypothetical protein
MLCTPEMIPPIDKNKKTTAEWPKLIKEVAHKKNNTYIATGIFKGYMKG